MAEKVSKERLEEILSQDSIVLLDIYTDTCPPCKMLAPVMERLSEEYADRATVVKMDGVEEREFTSGLGISSVPTVILYINGEERGRMMGFRPESYYAKVLNDQLGLMSEPEEGASEDGVS